ncbi:uncharacterized protein N7483_001135 [Penicillium malachiteum]|uniref:uncharacterized protein n=1 Tax=Penicillium malachiteum TaxID=1324776 RepID=UPI0025493EB9|nr:uncharacterized protein N7483_001135 [Penicillium malachiteum]KAJ5736010.1 hypothetical protein N7483_001135 [Penicillium malachiteum]
MSQCEPLQVGVATSLASSRLQAQMQQKRTHHFHPQDRESAQLYGETRGLVHVSWQTAPVTPDTPSSVMMDVSWWTIVRSNDVLCVLSSENLSTEILVRNPAVGAAAFERSDEF